MKKHFAFILSLLIVVSALFAADEEEKIVLTKRNGVKLYKSQVSGMGEKPMETISKDAYLKVKEETRHKYKVETSRGTVGWLNKADVTANIKGKKVGYQFDEMQVQGWLDNPMAVYIIDMDESKYNPIQIDKSFKDKIDENMVKEELQEDFHEGGFQ
ncbi:MAG: hypothetical protein ACLFQK_02050 [Fibrobacterota bacterium]